MLVTLAELSRSLAEAIFLKNLIRKFPNQIFQKDCLREFSNAFRMAAPHLKPKDLLKMFPCIIDKSALIIFKNQVRRYTMGSH